MDLLATETRVQIFGYFQDNLPALKSAGSTCRTWRANTQSLIFQDLTLKLESLNTFEGDGGSLRRIGPLVKHLTLRSAYVDKYGSTSVYLREIPTRFRPSRSLWHQIFGSAPPMFPHLESFGLKDAKFRHRSDMYRVIGHVASSCKSLNISNCGYGLHDEDDEANNDNDDDEENDDDDDAVAKVTTSDVWQSFAIDHVTFEDAIDAHGYVTSGDHLIWLTSLPWRTCVKSLSLTVGRYESDEEVPPTLASWLRTPSCNLTSLILTLIDNIEWPSPASTGESFFWVLTPSSVVTE
jgi:hypothetical protein